MNKNNKTYYLPIFIALGAGVGVAFDNLSVGICIGIAIGVVLDNKKKK